MRIEPTRPHGVGNSPSLDKLREAGMAPAAPSQASQTAGDLQSDQVNLSQQALDMRVARSALAETPAVRQDRVSAVRAQLESGEYKVDSREVARKLLSGE